MKECITKILAAIAGAVVSFFSGLPPLVGALLLIMSLDYVTGLITGWMGVSPKTEHGGLSSRTAFVGLMKKMLILIIVALAAIIDSVVAAEAGIQFAAVSGATCLWFMASEGVSILENAVSIGGTDAPPVLRRALEIMQSRGTVEKKEPPGSNE